MNYSSFWIVWVILSVIQTSLFFSYWLKAKDQQKKWDEHYKDIQNSEQEVDMRLFLVYNNKAYWEDKNAIYRGSYKDGKIFMKTIEKIDPFEIKDISPMELMGILDQLKDAKQ